MKNEGDRKDARKWKALLAAIPKEDLRGAGRQNAYPPPPRRTYGALRWIGWNAFLLSVGLALVVGIAEVWLRVTTPIMDPTAPSIFISKVGLILKPNAEVRATNRVDYWTISQTNSLGFLDREPLNPQHASASCHITMIGDSFVEARQVPVAEKFHVRLEALATRHLPHSNITTSAFGSNSTGQINQLPYYDEFARHLHPKLIVLVFVSNDFVENSPILAPLTVGFDAYHPPFAMAVRDENGTITVRPPSPDFETFWLLRHDSPRFASVKDWLVQKFYLVSMIKTKELTGRLKRFVWGINKPKLTPLNRSSILAWEELLRRYPHYATLLDEWSPSTRAHLYIPPVFEDATELTGFALDQFKTRAGHDGAQLVILSTTEMGTRGSNRFDRLSALADAKEIPVINQYDYILRQDADPADAHWEHDFHWNPTGHQWAAEALLEYLKQHPEICDGAATR